MKFVDYLTLDQRVCQLASSIEANILRYINPLNLNEQKQKFFLALEKKEEYNPLFTYAPRNPLYSYFSISPTFETYRKELKECLNLIDHDSLGLIFEKKILDLFDRMELVRSVGTPNFSNNSEEYYGKVDKKTLAFANEAIDKKFSGKDEKITFEEAKKTIESFLKKKKLNYKVVQRESSGSKFSVNIRTKQILVNKDAHLTKGILKRLIIHEIEGHVYRYENGMLQPYLIFGRGLSKETLETEEGLAVSLERENKIAIDEQLKEYAGRIIAINLASKKSFFETFEELISYFSAEDSFKLTLRAKRGIHNQSEPGAFTKDSLYLKGFLTVQEFLKDHELKELYFGRYSIYDVPIVKDIDGLVQPKYLPESLK